MRITALVFCCLCLFASVLPDALSAAGKKAESFELEDQHGTVHKYGFPRDKVIFLAMADRRGSEQLEQWIKPVSTRYGSTIDILGIADLSQVPASLRGLVRKFFTSRLDYPVMLDWSGTVCRVYECREDSANIFIINKQGDIILRKYGTPTAADLKEIYRVIDELLQGKQQDSIGMA